MEVFSFYQHDSPTKSDFPRHPIFVSADVATELVFHPVLV